jgi:hypothetical protein
MSDTKKNQVLCFVTDVIFSLDPKTAWVRLEDDLHLHKFKLPVTTKLGHELSKLLEEWEGEHPPYVMLTIDVVPEEE